MTHRRDPLHPLDALNQSCKAFPGGIEELAKRRGVNVSTMYKKLERRVETHNIGYSDELSDLLHDLKAAGVANWDATLYALAHRHGGTYVRLPELPENPDGSAHMLTEQVLRMVKEQGDVAAWLAESMSGDGVVDSREYKTFEQQHAEAVAAMMALAELVRSLHEQARKAGRVR